MVRDQIRKLIQKYERGTKKPSISIFGKNYSTGKTLGYQADREFGTASIIKIAIALALFSKAENGEINLDSPIKLSTHQDVLDLGAYTNGALAFLPEDATLTLRLACFFMLRLSDNPATNLILKFVSQDEVNTYLRHKGYTYTRLTISSIRPQELEARQNYLGMSTAREMSSIFAKIAEGRLLKNKKLQADLLRMIESDYPEATYNRYLPVPWNVEDSKVKVKHIYEKGGSFPKFELLTESLGLVTDKNELISISVYTQNITQKNNGMYPTNLHPDHPATLFIAQSIKEIFRALY